MKDKVLPKGLQEEQCEKGKEQETSDTTYFTPVDPILDAVENKLGA